MKKHTCVQVTNHRDTAAPKGAFFTGSDRCLGITVATGWGFAAWRWTAATWPSTRSPRSRCATNIWSPRSHGESQRWWVALGCAGVADRYWFLCWVLICRIFQKKTMNLSLLLVFACLFSMNSLYLLAKIKKHMLHQCQPHLVGIIPACRRQGRVNDRWYANLLDAFIRLISSEPSGAPEMNFCEALLDKESLSIVNWLVDEHIFAEQLTPNE